MASSYYTANCGDRKLKLDQDQARRVNISSLWESHTDTESEKNPLCSLESQICGCYTFGLQMAISATNLERKAIKEKKRERPIDQT